MLDRAIQALVLLVQSWGVLFQCVGLVVQVLGLLGLAWYTTETRRMRRAAEEQVRVSQAQYIAGLTQAEALSKPCLTLWSELRNAKEAILQLHGAIGSFQVRGDQGDFAIENIGTGVAFNIEYKFKEVGSTPNDHSLLARYIPYVHPGTTQRMVEAVTSYPGRFTLVLNYKSISGRKYQTTIELLQNVILDFSFTEVKS